MLAIVAKRQRLLGIEAAAYARATAGGGARPRSRCVGSVDARGRPGSNDEAFAAAATFAPNSSFFGMIGQAEAHP